MAARTAVVAGTATAVSGRVARRQARKFDQQAQEEEQAAPEPEPEPEPAAAPAQDEMISKIQELAQLHTQGVLSDEEFSAAKAKVLGI
jgi:hypothetical protein